MLRQWWHRLCGSDQPMKVSASCPFLEREPTTYTAWIVRNKRLNNPEYQTQLTKPNQTKINEMITSYILLYSEINVLHDCHEHFYFNF